MNFAVNFKPLKTRKDMENFRTFSVSVVPDLLSTVSKNYSPLALRGYTIILYNVENNLQEKKLAVT